MSIIRGSKRKGPENAKRDPTARPCDTDTQKKLGVCRQTSKIR